MLNSTEHEIYPAHKCLEEVILTFISSINTTSESFKASNIFFFFQRKKFYNISALLISGFQLNA